ncbi:MAG: twin-arginine translocase TatA/TatE family subunit [Bacteroidales bacterium]|nr:twin-arginine translocase TatA/TatE family subunit [Candidatus Equibacterium intestinale]
MKTILLFGSLGWPEIIIILFVVVLLFGGKKIPELMRGVGKGVKEFKKGMKEVEGEVNEIKAEIEKEEPKETK